ncbi:MAG TPA: hypothetical protein VF719_00055 [Abditibacteriaceae bacterium]
MQTVADKLAEISTIEGPVIKQGRDMIMNLSPKAGVKPLPKALKDNRKNKSKNLVEEVDEDAEFERLQQAMIEDDDHDDTDAETGEAEVIDIVGERSEADDSQADGSEVDGSEAEGVVSDEESAQSDSTEEKPDAVTA